MASDKRWPTWWRRQGHARGRYAPRLWPVWPVAITAVLVASALAGGIYLGLLALAASRPGPNGGPTSIDLLDVIKTTITVAGFVGAVLVGVYGYRKQQLVEGDARRADAEQLAQRYTTAADQLGHEKAAVRLAGVYAMARLADDWDEQRQVCIDVLCAYVRMPYETDTASEKHREGEREVRHAIIRVISDHLNPRAPTAWCGHYFDFANATFDGGDFSGVKFAGGEVSFINAKFTGGDVSFVDAEFAGGEVYFDKAEFAGGKASFNGAAFTGGKVSFDSAEFAGGEASFFDAEFSGGRVSFTDARFTGSAVHFINAKFTGGMVSFADGRFADGRVYFSGAEFTGGAVYFNSAEFGGGEVSFSDASHTGCAVYLSGAKFTDASSIITWGPFNPPAAWTALQEGERR